MSRLNEIKSTVEKISKQGEISESIDQELISNLTSDFSKLGTHLREFMQDITKQQILQIVNKLKKGSALTEEDLKCIELWIVGDAEYFTKLENNFRDWIGEMNRIIVEIKNYSGKEIDLESCNRLRALSKDAVRNASDIDYFVGERDRIERFKESTIDIDVEERETLIDILHSKLGSELF